MIMIDINRIESYINDIDLTKLSTNLHNKNMIKDFLEKPGINHYYLISYFANLFNGSTFLDIGTNEGASALAMTYGNENKIYSFDLVNNRKINENINNISYVIDDITREYKDFDGKFNDLILSSKFIMLDTEHDGKFENKFYLYLKQIKYSGYLFLDDIYLYSVMTKFWNNIKEEKIDLTKYGHWSGSGLVIFE